MLFPDLSLKWDLGAWWIIEGAQRKIPLMFPSVVSACSGPVATAGGARVEQGVLEWSWLRDREPWEAASLPGGEICQWYDLQESSLAVSPDIPSSPWQSPSFIPTLPSPLLPCLFQADLCQEPVVRWAVLLSSGTQGLVQACGGHS